jgi:hypothetical protein
MPEIKLSDGRIVPSDVVNILEGGSGVNLNNISSSSQLLSLTTDQIAAIVAQIDGLISTQTNSIISTQSIILRLQRSIDLPSSGYTYIYNSTVTAYSTSVYDYLAQSTLVDSANKRLQTMYSSLSSVLLEEAADISTMQGYSAEYSTLLLRIDANDDALESQTGTYNSLSTSMGSYMNDYMIKFNSLQTEVDPNVISTLSSGMILDKIGENHISTLLHSTLQTISTMSFFSTTYHTEINNYGADGIYSALRNSVFSTIEQLWAEQRRLTSTITDYDNTIFWLRQSTVQEFTSLSGRVDMFYNDKLTQIRNQILRVKYSVQEWESFIGYIISQCMITKLQLYNSIDLLSYQIQQTPDASKSALILTQTIDQNTMQTIVNIFNPLTVSFNNIYTNITAELQLRSDFIQYRKNMTQLELRVLAGNITKASCQQMYSQLIIQLGQRRNDINTKINERTRLIQTNSDSIMNIFNNQFTTNIQSLNSYTSLVFVRPENIYPIPSSNPNTLITWATEPPFDSLNPDEFIIPGLDPLTFP